MEQSLKNYPTTSREVVSSDQEAQNERKIFIVCCPFCVPQICI